MEVLLCFFKFCMRALYSDDGTRTIQASRLCKCMLFVTLGVLTTSSWASGQKAAGSAASAPAAITTSLSGTLTNASGGPVASVSVQLESLVTHQTFHATSNEAGQFSFPGIPAGQYKLTAAKEGFKTTAISTMPLVAGDEATALLKMEAGLTTETVEASAQSVTSKRGVALAGKELSDIPENQRNFVNLVQLAAGANEGTANNSGSSANPGSQRSSSAVSVGGQLERTNNYMFDGIDNTVFMTGSVGIHPSVEAIGGMQVMASAYPASVGSAGGGVINLNSKSGEKKYHGNLFEYFRNNALDAYPFLFGAANVKHPVVRQNQFGGSIGGPVVRKITFFFDYEAYRLIQGKAPGTYTVPTTYEHDNPGDFTDIAGGTVTTIDPVGLQYFKLFPYPNSGTNAYVTAPVGLNFSRSIDARVDVPLSKRDKLFARINYGNTYIHTHGAFPDVTEAGVVIQPGGSVSAYAGQTRTSIYNAMANYAHTFTPHVALSLAAGTLLWDSPAVDLNHGTNVNEAFGQPGVNVAGLSGLAPVTIKSASALGDGGYNRPIFQETMSYTYRGDLTWQIGRHELSFGLRDVLRDWRYQASSDALGYWTFNDLQSLLSGSFYSVVRQVVLINPHYSMLETAGYVNDNWRVTKRLTVNFGARYNMFTPPTEIKNQLANFDVATGGIIIAGQNGVSKTANVDTDHTGLSPRLGFNLDLNRATTVRGGFGIATWLPSQSGSYENTPYAYALSACSSTGSSSVAICADGYRQFAQGLPAIVTQSASTPTGTLTGTRARNFSNMALYQFNLGIEHSFGGADTAKVTYVGSLGRHVTRIFPDLNAPPPNTASDSNTLRPYYSVDPHLTTVGYSDSEGSSSYNSLQTTFAHRAKYGVTFIANYALAHGLDNARPYTLDSTGYGSSVSEAKTRDYGNSTFDIRQRLTSTIAYNVPLGKNAHGIQAIAEKGWVVNVLGVWATNLPFTVLNASNVSNTNPGAANTDRPDQVGNPNLSNKSTAKFFNTAAFSAQTKGTLGNARRNQLYGPHSRKADISLFKNFTIHDSINGQFRTECFNVTNTANFASPVASLGNAQFGKLVNLPNNYVPREVQFALRLQF